MKMLNPLQNQKGMKQLPYVFDDMFYEQINYEDNLFIYEDSALNQMKYYRGFNYIVGTQHQIENRRNQLQIYITLEDKTKEREREKEGAVEIDSLNNAAKVVVVDRKREWQQRFIMKGQ